MRAAQKGIDAGLNRTLDHQIGDHRFFYLRELLREFIRHGSRVKELIAIAKRLNRARYSALKIIVHIRSLVSLILSFPASFACHFTR